MTRKQKETQKVTTEKDKKEQAQQQIQVWAR
jgi:hypothetical protein